MPFGGSDGQYYDDHLDYLLNASMPAQPLPEGIKKVIVTKPDTRDDNVYEPPETMDQNVLTPKGLEGNQQFQQDPSLETPISATTTASTMPPGASTEPAGALKVSGGTETPENSALSNISFLKAGKALNTVVDKAIDFVAKSPEMLQNLPENVLKSVIEAGRLPGDVQSGKVPAGSVQEVERAFDLANMMVFGPAPVASKMADGTLGSFMGVKSQTINKTKLYKAQEMEFTGATKDEIYEATGTYKGRDNKWRQEIPDQGAKINMKNVDAIADERGNIEGLAPRDKTTYLPDVLDHPKLFEAYPHLKMLEVKPMPEGINALGQASWDALYIAPQKAKDFKDTLLHEVQHYIQTHEGFSLGGAASMFLPARMKEAEKVYEDALKQSHADILEAHPNLKPKDVKSAQDIVDYELLTGDKIPFGERILNKVKEAGVYDKIENMAKAKKILQDAIDKANESYMRLRGEVEARNVEARQDYTASERAAIPPYRSEDRPGFAQTEPPQQRGRIPIRKEEPITFRRAANDNTPGMYNPREPNMIGSDAIDAEIDAAWKRIGERQNKLAPLNRQIDELMSKYPHTEFDKARLTKLRQQRTDIEDGTK